MSGWYSRFFAWTLRHGDAAQHRLYRRRKEELFAGVHGTVVEIGPGSGINLRYLPQNIRWIGVEPNPHLHNEIRKKLHRLGIDGKVVEGGGEAIPVDDGSADFVIVTLVLCSVNDPGAVLNEAKRILRPRGQLLFIEHVGAADGTRLRRVQRAIKPLWRRLADGCEPDRDTARVIEMAGFADVQITHFELPTIAWVVKPHIFGRATSE